MLHFPSPPLADTATPPEVARTYLVPDSTLASTSDTEQIPGGASLTRDVVSQPQPPIGGPATRELGFGELGSNRCDSSSPGPRTPEGTGGWRVACGVWRVACRGALGLMPYGN